MIIHADHLQGWLADDLSPAERLAELGGYMAVLDRMAGNNAATSASLAPLMAYLVAQWIMARREAARNETD